MEKTGNITPADRLISESAQHTQILRSRRLVPLAVSAVLLLGGCEFTDQPDATPKPSAPTAAPLPPHTPGCLQPTVNELRETRELLNSPEAPQVQANANYNSAKLLPEGAPILGDADFRYWQHDMASSQGINLADSPTGKAAQLSYEEQDLLRRRPDTALAELSLFAKNYDMSIQVPTKEAELKGLDVSPLTNELVEGGYEVGSNIVKLRDELEKYPTDMFKRLGIKHIALVRGDRGVELPNGKKMDLGGQVNFKDHRDTIYVDIYNANVLDHEIWHTVDLVTGCMNGDYAYQSLNGAVDVYADETPKNVYSLWTFWQENNNREMQRKPLLDAADVYTMTDYGMTDVLEDKAEIGKYLTDGGTVREACWRDAARIKSKAILLLARLSKWYPGFGKYVLSTGDHCRPD